MTTLAENIDYAIERRGETAAAIAERAGISDQQLSQYRHGERTPKPTTIVRLAEATGVNVEWLLTAEGASGDDPFALPSRAVYEIDGILEDWVRPVGEEARWIKQQFMRRFKRHCFPVDDKFSELSGVVRIVFGSLLARAMHQAREGGYGYPEDPAWRGDVAGRLLKLAEGRVEKREPAAGFDEEPESTRAWIQVLGEMMEEWERGVPTKDGRYVLGTSP